MEWCVNELRENTEVNRLSYKMKRKYYDTKSQIGMFLYSMWWRFLWLTRLANPYSVFMCRHNFYIKYMDGRCQYCGKVH